MSVMCLYRNVIPLLHLTCSELRQVLLGQAVLWHIDYIGSRLYNRLKKSRILPRLKLSQNKNTKRSTIFAHKNVVTVADSMSVFILKKKYRSAIQIASQKRLDLTI